MVMGCSVDFKVVGDERGIYYDETSRCVVYLNKHENIEDIYKTIQHEVIHYCISANDITIDEGQEEKLIFNIQWADHSIY